MNLLFLSEENKKACVYENKIKKMLPHTINVTLTQHSRNCFASIGDVKFKPHVSLVIGSFQYTKHSDAWPIRVPTAWKKCWLNFQFSFPEFLCSLTWLHESHVKNFVHLAVVGSNVEHAFGRVLDARDVHRHQVLGHLLPFHCARTAGRHMKHFRPQPSSELVSTIFHQFNSNTPSTSGDDRHDALMFAMANLRSDRPCASTVHRSS